MRLVNFSYEKTPMGWLPSWHGELHNWNYFVGLGNKAYYKFIYPYLS